MSYRRRYIENRISIVNPPPSRCLGVFGLSIYTTEQQILNIFKKYGPVEKVQLVIDGRTNRSRGFCFVYFEKYEDSKMAKEHCTDMEIDGRKIRVDYSITAKAHCPTLGTYSGHDDRHRRDRYNDDYHGKEWSRGGGGRHRSPSPYYSSRRRRYERSRSRSSSQRR